VGVQFELHNLLVVRVVNVCDDMKEQAVHLLHFGFE
jgi:hypothetical protein